MGTRADYKTVAMIPFDAIAIKKRISLADADEIILVDCKTANHR